MPTERTTHRRLCGVLGLLSVFILAAGLWDYFTVSLLTDTILPPSLAGEAAWVKRGDWSAIQCYEINWSTVLVRWAGSHVSDAVLVAAIVLLTHGLLWSGVYAFGRALLGGSPWIALLAVALVRISPDLFQVHLLSAQAPSRLVAVGLAFWSSALTIRRRWVEACCLAGLIAHFSPTVACWFAQFIIVTMFCLNYEWGWRKSLIGAACFLAIAGKPLVMFLIEGVAPDAPIRSEAMVGLHMFADPSLSPFSVGVWAYVCLVVYLAMAFVWLKRYFSRTRTPVATIFFLLGLGGVLLDVIFVGIIPVERAARFQLHNLRAFWFLWIAVFYAPALADELMAASPKGTAWWPVFRGLCYSMPLVWSGVTLLDRLHQPPRWNRAIVFLMMALLFFTVTASDRPIAEPSCALVVGLAALAAAAMRAALGGGRNAAKSARAMVVATAVFAILFLSLDGGALARAVSQTRRVLSRNSDWAAACRWIAEQSPADSVWAAPWRPRQFRCWTGRAVLVNRAEVPDDPSRRFEWFLMYAETHQWPHGVATPLTASHGGERWIEWLSEYRCRFVFGERQTPQPRPDRLVVSSALPQGYGVRYVVCDRDSLPQLAPGYGSVMLEPLHVSGPFELYQIRSTLRTP